MGTCSGGAREGLRCRLDGIDRGDGWIGCGFHPERPTEIRPFDPEYVRIVVKRLAVLHGQVAQHHRHTVEYCMVDLGRALGEIPAGDVIEMPWEDGEELPTDNVHMDEDE